MISSGANVILAAPHVEKSTTVAFSRNFYICFIDVKSVIRFYLAHVYSFARKNGDALCEIRLCDQCDYPSDHGGRSTDADCAVVTANGFQIKLNGQPFVIKGMNYSPVPIGVAPGDGPPNGVYGDYFVPNFTNVWKPDIDKIREAGINVIKLYAGNPDLNAGAPGTAGNWKQFLDYCYNGGINPVYVVMFSYTQGGVIAQGSNGLNDYIRQYDELVKSTVKHPAVFGYIVGNEIFDGVTQNPQFWQNFGNLINAAQGAGLSQGQRPFLMTATNDNFTPENSWPAIKLGEQSGKLVNLDSWCINIYRGDQFGGANNSVFTQYFTLMTSSGSTVKKPLILGEWGTPHTTRPANVYGQAAATPVTNLDDVPVSQMGPGQPYFAAQPAGTFLNTQWNTIKTNLMAGSTQVCVGGFIFDWCDEYWKGNNNNVQVGGPNINFQGGAFAGGYWDEAGFGVTSAVDQSTYGQGKSNIARTLFKGYDAIKTFYNASSWPGSELYGLPGLAPPDLPALRQDIRHDIHEVQAKLHHLKQQNENGTQKTPRVRRLLQMQIAVLEARLLFPTDEVLQQMEDTLEERTGLGRVAMRTLISQLNARLAELQVGG